MKPKQRKLLAARIRDARPNHSGTPCEHYTHQENDVIVVQDNLTLRLRNFPSNLEKVAKDFERGSRNMELPPQPHIPDLEEIIKFYGSAKIALEKIMQQLLIQKKYMEEGQVNACRKMCKELIDRILK